MDIKVYRKINKDLKKKIGFSFDTIMDIIHPDYQFIDKHDDALGPYITSVHSLNHELTDYTPDKPFLSGGYYLGHNIHNRHLKDELEKYLKSVCKEIHVYQTSLLLVIPTEFSQHKCYDNIIEYKLHLLTPSLMHDYFYKDLLVSAKVIEKHLRKVLEKVQMVPQNTTDKQIQIGSTCLRFKKVASRDTEFLYRDVGAYTNTLDNDYVYKLNDNKLYNMNKLFIKFNAVKARFVLNRTDNIINRDLRKYKKYYQKNVSKIVTIMSDI